LYFNFSAVLVLMLCSPWPGEGVGAFVPVFFRGAKVADPRGPRQPGYQPVSGGTGQLARECQWHPMDA
jgi:hypothetical protein